MTWSIEKQASQHRYGTKQTCAPEAIIAHLRKRGPPSLCASSTHSLPQSNLAVMCCLTSLMRSWVRWPTSTCLLRSSISFITCQSRWNKSPSFFCGSGKRWGGRRRKIWVERSTESQSMGGWMEEKLTGRKDRMRMADSKRDAEKKMKIWSENKVIECTLKGQVNIKSKRRPQGEKQTEGLKKD